MVQHSVDGPLFVNQFNIPPVLVSSIGDHYFTCLPLNNYVDGHDAWNAITTAHVDQIHYVLIDIHNIATLPSFLAYWGIRNLGLFYGN